MAKIVRVPRSWWVAASLFVILLTTFGTVANTVGVFVPELTRQFVWGRGQVSLLTSTIALAAAASAFPVGWLLDRIEAKFVMVGGTAAAVAGYVLASRAEDFTHPWSATYCWAYASSHPGRVRPRWLSRIGSTPGRAR